MREGATVCSKEGSGLAEVRADCSRYKPKAVLHTLTPTPWPLCQANSSVQLPSGDKHPSDRVRNMVLIELLLSI